MKCEKCEMQMQNNQYTHLSTEWTAASKEEYAIE
jgi:hypothetical protein